MLHFLWRYAAGETAAPSSQKRLGRSWAGLCKSRVRAVLGKANRCIGCLNRSQTSKYPKRRCLEDLLRATHDPHWSENIVLLVDQLSRQLAQRSFLAFNRQSAASCCVSPAEIDSKEEYLAHSRFSHALRWWAAKVDSCAAITPRPRKTKWQPGRRPLSDARFRSCGCVLAQRHSASAKP